MSKGAYHNLDGWMRDVQRALRDGDTRSYELAELLLEVDELVDPAADHDTDLEDAEDSPGGEPQLELALPGEGNSPPVVGPTEGHDSVRRSPVERATRMRTSLERVRTLARAGARGTALPLVRTRT